jgi:branched-chain amino acid transport system substrate-binding protein
VRDTSVASIRPLLAALGVTAGVLAACRAPARPVAIGYAFPRWGQLAVRVALDEIASWPATMRPTVRIIYDSSSTGDPPDIEVSRAQRFAAIPELVGIVGHGGSRGTLAAAPVYNQAGIPEVAPTSTSRLVKRIGPWTFQLPPDDSVEGAFLAQFAAERLGARRVSLFYVTDEYGAGLRDGVAAEAARRQVRVLDEVGYDNRNDLAPLVAASFHRGVPDVVIVAGRQRETAHIARAAWRLHPGQRVLAGDGALVLPLLVDEAGPAADSIYVVAFWMPDRADSVSRAFVERFTRIAGRPPQSGDAMNHDALMVMARAVADAGPRRAAIRAYLASLGVTRPPYHGVTGPITFTATRAPALIMTRVHGREVQTVSPP